MHFTRIFSLTLIGTLLSLSSESATFPAGLQRIQQRDTILDEAVGLVGGILSGLDTGYKLPKGAKCTASRRETILELVELGYGANTLLEGQEYFRAIPFAQDCKAEM